MTIPVSPQVVNTSGALQGGLIATLIDVAGGHFGVQHLETSTTMTAPDMNIATCVDPPGHGIRSAPDAANVTRDGHAGRRPQRC